MSGGELTVHQMMWMFMTSEENLRKWCRDTGNEPAFDDIRSAHLILRDRHRQEMTDMGEDVDCADLPGPKGAR